MEGPVRNKNIFFTLIISLFFLQANAHVGSVSAATGDAGRAAIEASESPFVNPASLGFISGYYFSAGYGLTRQQSPLVSIEPVQDLSLSVTDNMRETVVPTSFAYLQETQDQAMRRQFKLSLGNFMTQKTAFGFAVLHQNDRLPETSYGQTNMETGFIWAPNSSLGFATVFNNMIPPSTDVPEIYRLKQSGSLAATINYKRFVRVKMDITTDSDYALVRPLFAAGIESYMNDWFILRWGAQRDNEKATNKYTAGLGFIGPKFAFNYAYQNSREDLSLDRHSVDLVVPIW